MRRALGRRSAARSRASRSATSSSAASSSGHGSSWRSEEHTSELQSQSNLVCRLLLEKKKHRYERSKTERQIRHRGWLCACLAARTGARHRSPRADGSVLAAEEVLGSLHHRLYIRAPG